MKKLRALFAYLKRNALVSFSILAVLVFGAVLLLYRLYFSGDIIADNAAWGQFGDYIGGLSTGLFSLLSFLAVLYTLHLQRRSIILLQRQIGHSAKDSLLAGKIAACNALMNVYGELMSSKFSALGTEERKRLRDMQINLASIVLSLASADITEMRARDVSRRFGEIAKDLSSEQWKEFFEKLKNEK